jgi:hypothetical protein
MSVSFLSSVSMSEGDFSPIPIPIEKSLSPGEKIDRALSILKGRLGEAFEGRVKPGLYIQPADCGVGKSATAQSSIADWKVRGFPGDGGIIVAVSTLAEIDAYISGCKLDPFDYAAFTANPFYNAYGLGRDRAAQARVLLTTHEQFRRRVTECGTFAATNHFYFRSDTRKAIIWDEGLVPALPASFDLNNLQALPAALRGRSKRDRDAFEALVPDRPNRLSGYAIAVPYDTARLAHDIALNDKTKLNEGSRQTLDAIGKLGGNVAYMRLGKGGDWTLIGRGAPLPTDLPPTFVLDASARLTGNYNNLHRYGFKVVHMEPALVSYANLTVHWWNRGCGKTALAKSDDRSRIIKVIAALINDRSDELWLVIHSKSFGREAAGAKALPDDLTARLAKPENVRSVTWGRHLGSNAYRDVANVIVLGSYNYNDAAHDALHIAFSGSTDGQVIHADRRRREDAEFMHNVYQGVCRSRIRQHVDGVCQPATAYFIMTHTEHRQRLVERAFTGCSISAWQPAEPKRISKFDIITTTMMALFDGRTILNKAEVIEACGTTDATYLDKVVRGERFKKFAIENGISKKAGKFFRHLPSLKAA